MSMTDSRIHERIRWLLDRANDFLPEPYYLGYRIAHTHAADGTPLPDSELVRSFNEIHRSRTGDRARLQRLADAGHSWAAADLAALPSEATDVTGVHLVLRFLHRPSGILLIRTYSLQQIQNLITDETKTVEEKRQAIRTALANFYAELRQRVQDAGWEP